MKPRPDLLAAYKATTYFADLPAGRLALRIGEVALELNDLMIQHELGSWAFITACNPLSERLPVKENAKRLAKLAMELDERGFVHFPGEGVGSSDAWPCEQSFFILGMNLEEASALGRAHGQHAIIFGRFNKAAQLVWCNE